MKITIITTCYNSADTLCDTLNSVLQQDYSNYEYILVDGASTDGTKEILARYEARFQGRMRWTSKPDKGIYDAMNKALSNATGDVIGFLNSDDFYTSHDVLSSIAHGFTTTDADAVCADVHYVCADDTSEAVRYYSSRWFRRWTMRFGLMPAHPTFYCKREVYEKYGNFNTRYKIAADFDAVLRFVFLHRIRLHYIHKDFVTMRQGGISSSGLESHKQIMRDHLHSLHMNGVYSNRLLLSLRYIYKACELIYSCYLYCFSEKKKKLFLSSRKTTTS